MEQANIDFDDLRAFFMVAETGSFAKAAQRLDSSKSLVSRRVARLETLLVARLLHRTARGTVLTEAGQIYYEHARTAMIHLERAAETVSESISDISGSVRITAPIYFGAMHLGPVLCDFLIAYPRIDLDINISDEKVDIMLEGYDIAIRAGHLPDSSLTLRPLCRSKRLLVASPGYIDTHTPILRPEDLSTHSILHYNSLMTQDLWRYHVGDEIRHLAITPHLRSNSGTVLMSAVTSGAGLAVMPNYIAEPYLQSGQVIQVLPDVDWGISPISVLIPSGRSATRRVRTLIDFITERFGNRLI